MHLKRKLKACRRECVFSGISKELQETPASIIHRAGSHKCLSLPIMLAGDKQRKLSHPNKEENELYHLLTVINAPPSKQHQPYVKYVVSKKPITALRDSNQNLTSVAPPSLSRDAQNQSDEALQLKNFSGRYKDERNFNSHCLHKQFLDICTALTKHRLCSEQWLSHAPAENVYRVLLCLRILLRDSALQKHFYSMNGFQSLTEYFCKVKDEYLYSADRPFMVDSLMEMTNIFQKLSARTDLSGGLLKCNIHKPLVHLLNSKDLFVLHGSLHTLIRLAQSAEALRSIGELNVVEVLLRIIQEYDSISKKLAANLLRLLCGDPQTIEEVKMENGIPLLLSQLHSDNVNLLWLVVWCLVLLAKADDDCRDAIRQMGGIPLLLSLLHDRKFVSERIDASADAVTNGFRRKLPSTEEEDFTENQYLLKNACCTALSELVLNDANAQQIVQANGIYSLGLLILPQKVASEKERKRVAKLQQNAFRALRFVFSMERNRRLFKHWFPPELYELFIDVGHYNRELEAYKPLADKINSLPEEIIKEISDHINTTDQNNKSKFIIGDYDVFEMLGQGAFGSVYKVRKKTGRQSFMALKELNLQNTAFGKNDKEKAQSVGQITNELKIMKEEMRHPNVVRYYKTFELNEKLYIVMELIEGAHLGEHFNSLKEKNERFTESRIWNVLMQLMLALRYLHKEKGIVHRDLTPNNVMLGENDKVTITDFGLAKQKRSDTSKMMSVVGTIVYSCPEVVQNHAYGEKADIWALGCILYQMCMLDPPFHSNNMLTLVNKIVAGDYRPIPKRDYSARLLQTIDSCLTVSPDQRPDILDLSGQLSSILLVHMDKLRISQMALEKKLDKERKRTQKHFVRANQEMQSYHRQFLPSQASYDRLTNLAGSGGAQGLKDEEGSESFVEAVDSGFNQSLALSLLPIQRGDISDEDSYPSSGSESRESSAGSVRSQHFQGNVRRPVSRRDPLKQSVLEMHSLELEIPKTGREAKASQDSGLSSGDPSPNISQSLCMQSTDLIQNGRGGFNSFMRQNIVRSQSTNEVAAAQGVKLAKRSRSAALLTISPNRLREISDPISQILHQLHKILYITQLPPTLTPNPNRRMIEQYKRALFGSHSSSVNLKEEMRKLIQGSMEIIDLDLGPPEFLKRSSAGCDRDSPIDPDRPKTPFYDPDYKDVGITYEYMNSILETTLEDSGYYQKAEGTKQMVS